MKAAIGFISTVIFLGAAARSVAVNNAPIWTESEVGLPLANSYVSTPVLAFDHYGTPAVAWSSVSTIGGANSIRCSQLLGLGLWNTRELANGINLGLRTALTFDRAERPSIAWVSGDGTAGASFNLGTPQSIAASGANSANPMVSLSTDLAGTLRGMYGRTTTGNFFDISYSGGNFSASNMTTLPGVTSILDAAMTTDGRGLRQLAARANLTTGGQGLVIASEPVGGGAWSTGVFASADNVTGVDIGMDPNDGRMALAYTTRDNAGLSKLFYYKFTGGPPTSPAPLDSSMVYSFEDLSLAFDHTDGRPAIAYERRAAGDFSGAGQLMFAYLDSSSVWQRPQTPIDAYVSLEALGGKPRRPSLAFDDYGTSWPAIAYVDKDEISGAERLHVAFDPPAPEPAAFSLLITGGLLARRRRKHLGHQ